MAQWKWYEAVRYQIIYETEAVELAGRSLEGGKKRERNQVGDSKNLYLITGLCEFYLIGMGYVEEVRIERAV